LAYFRNIAFIIRQQWTALHAENFVHFSLHYFLFSLTEWSDAKVKALLAAYHKHRNSFHSNVIPKNHVWKVIAGNINSTGGIQFTWEEVDKKWRNLKDR